MTKHVLICILLTSSIAHAKPLPKGSKVTVVKGKPMFVQGAQKVALLDGEHQGGDTISATLSDDGATIHVTWDRCGMGDPDSVDQIDEPMAHVTARLENLAGMALHLKKKYADAIPHFAAAVAANPDEPVFATNLLSAQSMGGKLDDADKTITAAGAKARAWFVWRLAVDSDLVAVAKRPAALALAAPKRGTATSKDLGDNGKLAIAGALVATTSNQGNGGPGSPYETDLIVYDTAAAREVLRIPLVTADELCDPSGGDDAPVPKCTRKMLAAQAAHAKAADAVLAGLGFAIVPGALADAPQDKATLTAPDGKTKVVFDDGGVHVTAGGKTFDADTVDRIWRIAFANGQVLFEISERHIYMCDDDSFRTALVLAAPAPTPTP